MPEVENEGKPQQGVEMAVNEQKQDEEGDGELMEPRQSSIVGVKGDPDIADLNRRKQMPNRSDSTEHRNDDYTLWGICWCCGCCGESGVPDGGVFQDKDFQLYGVGIYLYFKFLRKLMWLFFLLTILTLPLLVSCFYAKQTPPSMGFEQLSLANLGPYKVSNNPELGDIGGPSYPMSEVPSPLLTKVHEYAPSTWWEDPDKFTMRKDKAGQLFGLLDAAGALVMMFFLWYTLRSNKHMESEVDAEETTIKDYTVRVTGLPTDAFSREEIRDYFEREINGQSLFGGRSSVVDVAISYNDGVIYDEYKNKATMTSALGAAQVREDKSAIKSSETNLHNQNKVIEEMEENFVRWTVCAYVTFNKEIDKVNALKSFPNSCSSRLCMPHEMRFRTTGEGSCCACCSSDGYKLYITEADEPSNIKFENQQYSPCSLRIRSCLSTCCSFLFILISVVAIFAVQAIQQSIPPADTMCNVVTEHGFGVPTIYPFDEKLWRKTRDLTPLEQTSSGFTDEKKWPYKNGGQAKLSQIVGSGWTNITGSDANHLCTAILADDGKALREVFRNQTNKGDTWTLFNQVWRYNKTLVHITVRTKLGAEYPSNTHDTGKDWTSEPYRWTIKKNVQLLQMSDGTVEGTDGEKDPLTMCRSIHDCYCASVNLGQLAKDALDDPNRCKTIREFRILLLSLMVGGSVLVVVVNTLLTTFMNFMVSFEKHVSKTAEQVALTWKLFVGLFFNTGLVITLVNTKSQYLSGMIPGGILFSGTNSFYDFVPRWYEVVGQALMITMVVNAINPHIMQLVGVIMGPCSRSRAVGTEDNIVTQTELDQAYEPMDFSLAERYAAIANTFYVAYFYTAGMPLLLPVAMVTFYFMYWFDLIGFLRLYKKPPKYNASLANFMIKMLKPAVYVHLAVSIWVFGSETIMHNLKLDPTLNDDATPVLVKIAFNWNTFPLTVYLIFVSLNMIVWSVAECLHITDLIEFIIATLCTTIAKVCFICEYCCCCCPCYGEWFGGDQFELEGNPDFVKAIAYINFETYHICDQTEFKASFAPGCLPKTEPLYAMPAKKSSKSSKSVKGQQKKTE